jgi:type VI protein secretion system component VasF
MKNRTQTIMSTKRLTTLGLLLVTLFLATPGFSNEIKITPRNRAAEPITPAEAEQLTKRLEEIKAMDLKSMPRSERRALRKEVKEIDQKIQQSGYIYISVGALLIIVLLLILLL